MLRFGEWLLAVVVIAGIAVMLWVGAAVWLAFALIPLAIAALMVFVSKNHHQRKVRGRKKGRLGRYGSN